MYLETDLVQEAAELLRASPEDPGRLSGVSTREYLQEGLPVQEVRIFNETGAQTIGKPQGTYLTLTLQRGEDPERDYFRRVSGAIAGGIQGLLSLKAEDSVLVVGLGNRSVTPDALGPLAADHTVVTRHLVAHLPETFGDFRPVAAMTTGVLGNTGLESGELVAAVCDHLHPAAVIAVDALAARSASRLGTTIQLSNTGIVPGSGVGNHRKALNQETLHVPVLAVGVPTVIRAATLCADLGGEPEEQERLQHLVVTPKEIDSLIGFLSRVVGTGISLALQEGLTMEDVEVLLS